MNKTIKTIVGLIALLFLSALPSFAQYGNHISNTQVESIHDFYVAIQRTEPEGITAAHFYADGVTIYGDGTYRLDSDTNSSGQSWSSLSEDLYWDVMAGSGDITIAMEAALGLLTPAELDRALHPFRDGQNPLSEWYTGFFDWSSVGDIDPNHDNT